MTLMSLTPPADLVGKLVTWKPRSGAKRYATVHAYNASERVLVVEYPNPNQSPWSPSPTLTEKVSLSNGPFTIA
jgi:hypothetical protein